VASGLAPLVVGSLCLLAVSSPAYESPAQLLIVSTAAPRTRAPGGPPDPPPGASAAVSPGCSSRGELRRRDRL